MAITKEKLLKLPVRERLKTVHEMRPQDLQDLIFKGDKFDEELVVRLVKNIRANREYTNKLKAGKNG